MSISLEVLKETMKERKHDMLNNRSLTNELAIDDFMEILGYNKKRDTSVIRVYDDNVDWKVVYPTGSRIILRTFSVGEEISEEAAKPTFDLGVNENTASIILTNGEDIKIYGINTIEKSYAKIAEFSIYDTLNESQNKILVSLSKQGFDRGTITDIVMDKYITVEKVKDWLNKYRVNVVELISGEEKLSDTSKLDAYYNKFLNDVPAPAVIVKEAEESKEEVRPVEPADNQANTELVKELETLQADHAAVVSERDALLSEKEAVISEKEAITTERDALVTEKDSLLSEKESLNNQVTGLTAQVEELSKNSKDYSDALNQVSGLTVQNKSLLNQIDKMQSELAEKQTEIENINSEKEGLTSRIEELKQQINALTDVGVDDYIQQINDLTEEKGCLADENEKLRGKIKELKEQLDDLAGADKQKARELLDLVQISNDKPRQYVGVINTELFQYAELSKFVGCTLQKLSELKGHEAAPYIFDGDYFNVQQDGPRRDMMVNNKSFDIELNGMHEEEAINKLRIIFSHFDDIVFDCKLAGHLDDPEDNFEFKEAEIDTEVNKDLNSESNGRFKLNLFKKSENKEASKEADNENISVMDQAINAGQGIEQHVEVVNEAYTNNANEAFDGIEDDTLDLDSNDDFDNVIDNTQNVFGEQPVQQTNDTGVFSLEGTDEEEDIIEDHPVVNAETDDMLSKLYVVQLQSYYDLLMYKPEDGDVNYASIAYIGTNEVNFRITDSEELDKQFIKCVDAILAIEARRGRRTLLLEFKQCDLSQISSKINKYDSGNRVGIKITSSEYAVSGISDIPELVKTLFDICEKLGIDMSDIFVYIRALTNSLELGAFEITDPQIVDVTDCNIPDDGASTKLVFEGDAANYLIYTHTALAIREKLIKMSIQVQTRYMKNSIASYDDFLVAINSMISAALNNGFDNNRICNSPTLDSKYKVFSDDEDSVKPEHSSIVSPMNGTTYYVSKIEDWEAAETVLRVHRAVFRNKSVAVEIMIRNNVIDFINSGFSTPDPTSALSVYSLRNYILKRIEEKR